jgi:hypothetical protein
VKRPAQKARHPGRNSRIGSGKMRETPPNCGALYMVWLRKKEKNLRYM